jgi:phosphoribosylanthranilate isomerase
MTHVKICGITSLEDARAAVTCGAYALGFNFYRQSPRYIAPRTARGIIEELPRDVLTVGVFVNEESPEFVAAVATESGVAAVQLHGDEPPEYCRRLNGFTVIKVFRVRDAFDAGKIDKYKVDAVMLDAFSDESLGGSGKTFDWSLAQRARRLVPKLFLAGGLTPRNVAAAIKVVQPFCVDVCSGVESSPGKKDPEELRRFMSAVSKVK